MSLPVSFIPVPSIQGSGKDIVGQKKDIIKELPTDVALLILKFLNRGELGVICSVSKPWKQLASRDGLWKTYFNPNSKHKSNYKDILYKTNLWAHEAINIGNYFVYCDYVMTNSVPRESKKDLEKCEKFIAETSSSCLAHAMQAYVFLSKLYPKSELKWDNRNLSAIFKLVIYSIKRGINLDVVYDLCKVIKSDPSYMSLFLSEIENNELYTPKGKADIKIKLSKLRFDYSCEKEPPSYLLRTPFYLFSPREQFDSYNKIIDAFFNYVKNETIEVEDFGVEAAAVKQAYEAAYKVEHQEFFDHSNHLAKLKKVCLLALDEEFISNHPFFATDYLESHPDMHAVAVEIFEFHDLDLDLFKQNREFAEM